MSLSKFQKLNNEDDLFDLLTSSAHKRVYNEEENVREQKKRVCVVAAILDEVKSFRVIGRSPNIFRDRNRILGKILSMDDDLFTRHYRLYREDFFDLLDKIRPEMDFGKKYHPYAIDPIIRLCVALRFLGGGSYLDIAFGYEVPEKSVSTYALEVCELIDECVDNIIFPLGDENALRQLEEVCVYMS